jgi:hypothetical protein
MTVLIILQRSINIYQRIIKHFNSNYYAKIIYGISSPKITTLLNTCNIIQLNTYYQCIINPDIIYNYNIAYKQYYQHFISGNMVQNHQSNFTLQISIFQMFKYF